MAIVMLAEERGKNNLPMAYLSWLQYWEVRKNRDADTCSVTRCFNPATIGAHVVLAGTTEESYIMPICKTCRSKAKLFSIPLRVPRDKLVQAPKVK